uniref:Uncharacterized protein n=1 Tax=Anguilla anguilla TaxID=7936 RepID=A0A0E9WQK5_ANGAN
MPSKETSKVRFSFLSPHRLCFLCFVDKTTTMNEESEIHHYFTNSSVEINGVPFHTLRQMTFRMGPWCERACNLCDPPPPYPKNNFIPDRLWPLKLQGHHRERLSENQKFCN